MEHSQIRLVTMGRLEALSWGQSHNAVCGARPSCRPHTATFLIVGLTGVELAEQQKFTIPFLLGASLVMTPASIILGAFRI